MSPLVCPSADGGNIGVPNADGGNVGVPSADPGGNIGVPSAPEVLTPTELESDSTDVE